MYFIYDFPLHIINVKKLTTLKLVLKTTIMTPVKPQNQSYDACKTANIKKFKADKILESGLQRVMAASLMSAC
jgi:hypothetical protein